MSCLIPRLVKLHHDSLVISSSLHIMPLLHHGPTHPAFNSLLDRPFLSPDICQDKYHVHLSHDFLLLCFIVLSLTLCHMPLCLLIIRPLNLPIKNFPFVSTDSFVPVTHFISEPADQSWSGCCFIFTIGSKLGLTFPTDPYRSFTHSLMPLFLYCCVIYRMHVCGVLSWPHFHIYTALGRCGWPP